MAGRAAPLVLGGYLLITLVAALVPVGVAWLTKLLFDRLAGKAADLGDVQALGVGLAAAGVVVSVLPQTGQYLRATMQRAVALRALQSLYRAVAGFVGLGRFEDPAFLDRVRLAQQAASNAPNRVVECGLSVVQATLTLAGFILSLAAISPMLTGILLATAVPALLAELALSRRKADVLWDIAPAERRELFYSLLLISVQAAKEIRLFGCGPFLLGRMLSDRCTADLARARLDRRELVTQAGLALLGALAAGAGLVWAISAAWQGRLTVGDVAILIAAVAGAQAAMAQLVDQLAGGHQSLLLFDHYLAVLRAGPDLPTSARPVACRPLRRGIELRGVWFRYGDQQPWALREIDLTIPHGRTVALVGRNGAGKSTLVKLLCRFYDPSMGAILWDGVDLRELAPDELRSRIGVVFQDFMKYDLTVAENIAIADVSALADRRQIEAAAHRAGVHDTVMELPRGYDTLLSQIFLSDLDKQRGENGAALSGGQWQRLAVARALLRESCDLLVLDEPSAGLDAEAEYQLHNRLRTLRSGRTSVLISHRLGALRDADLIVTLDRGQVVEQGGHSALLAAGGPYSRLFTRQADGYRDQPADRLEPDRVS